MTRSSPRVTVLVCCYNYSEYVTAAIESVFGQTYGNIQTIVINDGSTDDSHQVISKLKKKHNFLYINQENQGVISAIEKGVSLAEGSYFIRLDADDILPDNYVATLVKAAKENPKASIFYTDLVNLDTGDLILSPPSFDRERLKHHNYIHATSMVKLSVMNAVSYDKKLKGMGLEDWDLFLSAVLQGEAAMYVEGTYLRYRRYKTIRSRSQLRRAKGRGLKPILHILNKNIEKYPDEMSYFTWLKDNISESVRRVDECEAKVENYEKKVQKQAADIAELNIAKAHLQAIVNSKTYKLAFVIGAPFRALKKPYSVIRRRAGLIKNKNRTMRSIESLYLLNRLNGLNKKRKNVSVYLRSYELPTSSAFIRIIAPFSHTVLKDSYKLRFHDGDRVRYRKNTDVVIVQRTAIKHLNDAKELVKQVSFSGARLFVDTDDAFSNIDKSHSEYSIQEHRISALNYLIEQADEVWFSTPQLQSIHTTKKSKVIQNTLDEKIWTKLQSQTTSVPEAEAPLEILYMGTMTHQGDFALILPALKRLHENYPQQFRLHIIGVAKLDEEYPWVVSHSPAEGGLYPLFVKWFSTIGPFDIGLSPLEDNDFNRNKSDIKCLDYMGIGVHPVVSDVEAYRNPELDELVTRIPRQEDWYSVLEKFILGRQANRQKAPEQIKRGYKYIKQNRLSERAAKSIYKSLEEANEAAD